MLKIVVVVPTESVEDAMDALWLAPTITGHALVGYPGKTMVTAVVSAVAFDTCLNELLAVPGAEVIEADILEDLEQEAA